MTSIRERRGLDVAAVRDHFPSLTRTLDGQPIAYLDGPGGTQVPRECISAMTAYLERSNANHGGAFTASRETDALRDETRNGRISAILDVTDPEPLRAGDELYSMPNVFITPHIAGAMGNELSMMGASVVTEVGRLVARESYRFLVTLHDLETMA